MVRAAGFALVSVSLANAAPAEPDLSKLPPPTATNVDFTRDIRPILEQSCLRCHGDEKPKSHFRLTSRETALKGGDQNTNDIVAGDSAHSRLIQYVSGLVEDMQMPPEGKAQPLTPAQIGLLRAWIDQGAAWSAPEQFPQSAMSFTPLLRWTGVSGDHSKFREIEGYQEGFGGGAQEFSIQARPSADTKLNADGHVLVPDQDIKLNLDWTKTDRGFVRGGVEHWRKYYDDHGGFYPPGTTFSLDRDLHMDQGRVWTDFGLTLPNWPMLVLGYEYQFKDGDESTLQWGPIAVPNAAGPKSIYPAAKHIDEHTHIIKLDVDYDVAGWHLADNARLEFYSLGTSRTNRWPDAYVLSPPNSLAAVDEHDSHTQGANTFSVNKQLADWLGVSGAYYYSHLEGDASVNQSTLDPTGTPVLGQQWSANDMTLRRDSESASVAGLLGPWGGLSLSAGVQGDWSRQEGSGFEQLLYGTPSNPNPALISSTNNLASGSYDRAGARENIAVRYTGIPWTVLFGEVRLRQETLHQFEEGYIEAFTVFGPFTNSTSADTSAQEYRVGFNSSPWQRLSFGGSFKHGDSHTDYVSGNTQPGNYPGFITWRNIGDNDVNARLVYRPVSWLKTAFNYRWEKTDFDSATTVLVSPGGPIEAGIQKAQVYSVDAVLTPVRRLYLSGMFSWSESRIDTALDGQDGLASWKGHVYSVVSSASYALNAVTAFTATFASSISDYAQPAQTTSLPAGIDYRHYSVSGAVNHRFPNHIVAGLRYVFSQYHEPTSGDATDYTAHGVFASVAVPWK